MNDQNVINYSIILVTKTLLIIKFSDKKVIFFNKFSDQNFVFSILLTLLWLPLNFSMPYYLKKKGNKGCVAVKRDISKAFDRVEWSLIEAVMRKLDSNDRWIILIMQCITSVSHRVVINECLSKAFKLERGLRQWDPLSPYLFLLCFEGLSIMRSKCLRDGSLRGVRSSTNGSKISHFFFCIWQPVVSSSKKCLV